MLKLMSQLGPRTLRNYIEWTKSIKELNTTVTIEWLSSFRPSTRISFNVVKAEQVHSILNDFFDTFEEEIEVAGKLTGVGYHNILLDKPVESMQGVAVTVQVIVGN